jgi:carbon starvation protein
VVVTFTGGWLKIFSPLPRLGFLAQADQLKAVLASGKLSAAQISQNKALIFNAQLDAVVCGIFMVLVAAILVDSARIWAGILMGTREATVRESPFVQSRLGADDL